MPRRRGGGGFGGGGFGFGAPKSSRGIGATSRPMSTAAAPSRAPPAPMKSQVPAKTAPASSQPGMLSQIASTAAGVAIGHTIGHAMVGGLGAGGSGEGVPQEASPSQGYMDDPQSSASPSQYSQGMVPCARELEDFIRCTQSSSELKYCEGLNYLLKQCKLDNGMS